IAPFLSSCDKFKDDVQPAKMSQLIVNDDHFVTKKNQGLQFNVLTNDSVGSNATLQFTQPRNGLIQPGTNGNVQYVPVQNFVGTDSLTYTACVGNDCASALVTINVQPDSINTCTLIARNDSLITTENQTFTLDILQNDSHCNGSLSLASLPVNGQARINASKQLVYAPNTNFTGTDRLTYTLLANGTTATGTVDIRVTPAQSGCRVQANPDVINLPHPNSFDSTAVDILANDTWCNNGTTVVANLVSQPTYGSASIVFSGPNTRLIYMTATPSRNVADTFQYRICQGNDCSTSTVTVNIQ
ncbi:MAG TPA: Ig-like domain-containing protein, partial [Adhaeribacter sp.]|nr:Ig-like domain-containing protein [Adhaeribacter sp.]